MQDVVWERLCAVDGNTEFVDASFNSFHGRSVMRDALAAARLAQDAFKDVLPAPGTLAPLQDSDTLLSRLTLDTPSVLSSGMSARCRPDMHQHQAS